MSQQNKMSTYSKVASKGMSSNNSSSSSPPKEEVKSSYTKPTLASIEEIYQLPANALYEVSDYKKIGLVQVDFNAEQEVPTGLEFLRSSVWAKVDGKPLCVAVNTPEPVDYVTSSVSIEDDGKTVKLEDGLVITSKQQIIFTCGVEGFHVRLARFRGEDLFITRSKIQGELSNWGPTNIRDAFLRVGGVSHDYLFEDTHSHHLVYHMMVSARGSITGTRQLFSNPDSGYVTLLTATSSWKPGTLAYEPNTGTEYGGSMSFPRYITLSADPEKEEKIKVDYDGRHLKVYSYSEFPGNVEGPLGVIGLVPVPYEQVNEFLNWGFYEKLADKCDLRAQPGESLTFLADGVTYRITHPSFEWRNSLRRTKDGHSGEPKISLPLHRAVLGNFASQAQFDEKFLNITSLPIATIREILTEGNPLVWIGYQDNSNLYEEIKANVSERRRVAFINFVLSVPHHEQLEALELWGSISDKLEKLVQFIIGLQRNQFFVVDTSEASRLVKRLTTKEESRIEAESRGARVYRGVNGFYYEDTGLSRRLPYGKFYVLLANKKTCIHPTVVNIAKGAQREASDKSRNARGHAKRGFNDWNRSAINRMLDKSDPQHLFQALSQLDGVDPTFFQQF
jgi:hypothetical protein